VVNTHDADGLLKIARGSLELLLAPSVGGSIARFDHVVDGLSTPILRGTAGVPASPLDAASFPLVPYCNRIRGGRFAFRGRQVRLDPNMAGDPSPLHGQGWLGPWRVESQSDSHAELVFRHDAGEWPWAWEARQLFLIDETGLSVRLGCRNLSAEAMPCGLGQHPYFPCTPGTRLATDVTSVWTIDDRVLPIEKVPAVGRYDIKDRLICGQDLDNGFGGWGGVARISAPDAPFTLQMSSPNARFFQLYAPAQGGLFVAEPVTHANAALNEPEEIWPELGLRVLEPGEEMSLDMRLGIEAATSERFTNR